MCSAIKIKHVYIFLSYGNFDDECVAVKWGYLGSVGVQTANLALKSNLLLIQKSRDYLGVSFFVE